jgi:hypothetical protein
MSGKGVESIKPEGSSMVTEATYNHGTKVLTIQYKDGGVYTYGPTPAETWEKLRKAKSTGSFVRTNVVGVIPEIIDGFEAADGRKALKLLRELVDHLRSQGTTPELREIARKRFDVENTFIATSDEFDQKWIPQVKKLLGL